MKADTILAVIALIFSIITGSIQIFQFTKSGSKIVVHAGLGVSFQTNGQDPHVLVKFMNHGRMSGTIKSFGLELVVDGDATQRLQIDDLKGSNKLESPFTIEASGSSVWAIPFSSIIPYIGTGQDYITFRAYAFSSVYDKYFSNKFIVFKDASGVPLSGWMKKIVRGKFNRFLQIYRIRRHSIEVWLLNREYVKRQTRKLIPKGGKALN